MHKLELEHVFAAGFEISSIKNDDMFEDNYIVDKDDTNDNYLALIMYDANFFPCDFWNMSLDARNKVISDLGNYHNIQEARKKGVAIAIDGKVVLKAKKK